MKTLFAMGFRSEIFGGHQLGAFPGLDLDLSLPDFGPLVDGPPPPPPPPRPDFIPVPYPYPYPTYPQYPRQAAYQATPGPITPVKTEIPTWGYVVGGVLAAGVIGLLATR